MALDGRQQAAPIVVFSAALFTPEAVKRAAYRFSDAFSFSIELDADAIRCEMAPLRPMSEEEVRAQEARFRNEVLDQDLRERIAAETSAIRNAILAYAFSETGLQGVE